MNFKKLALNIPALFFVLIPVSVSAQDKSIDILFVQDQTVFLISRNVDSVILDKKPFSIRYFGKQYEEKKNEFFAAQIAVLANSKDIGKISIGTATEDIPYFSEGTGIAADTDTSYNAAYINNEGHHYLYYAGKSDRRVRLLSKEKGLLQLEWFIPAIYYNEKELQFSELDFSALYFVFFIDRNNNELIDKDEVKIITVSFNK